MKNSIRNNKGFTLIELLIVLIIIGILAAIVVPVYGNLKSDAEDAIAKSALTSIRSAATLYTFKNPTAVLCASADILPAFLTSISAQGATFTAGSTNCAVKVTLGSTAREYNFEVHHALVTDVASVSYSVNPLW